MPLNPVIQLNKLTKSYKRKSALVNTTFTVYQGDLCGVAGIPGSGKTTLYNVLCGLIRDYAGTATIAGKNVTFDTLNIKRITGFVPAEPSLPEEMRAVDIVRFAASIRGYCDEARLANLFEQFSVARKKFVHKMTISERKRLAIISAAFFSPQILIMDEPTLGLDNRMKDRFFDFLVKEKEKGTTVLMTCNDYEEAQTVCSSVVVMHKGSVVNNSQKEQFVKLNTHRVSILSNDNLEPVVRYFRLNPIVEPNGYISFLYKGELDKLILALSHYTIKDLSITYPSLGETVATLYQEQEQEEFEKVKTQTVPPLYPIDENERELYSSYSAQPSKNSHANHTAIFEAADQSPTEKPLTVNETADKFSTDESLTADENLTAETPNNDGKSGDEINE